MTWSWRIGRLRGVDILVHATFLLLLAWVGASHWIETSLPRKTPIQWGVTRIPRVLA